MEPTLLSTPKLFAAVFTNFASCSEAVSEILNRLLMDSFAFAAKASNALFCMETLSAIFAGLRIRRSENWMWCSGLQLCNDSWMHYFSNNDWKMFSFAEWNICSSSVKRAFVGVLHCFWYNFGKAFNMTEQLISLLVIRIWKVFIIWTPIRAVAQKMILKSRFEFGKYIVQLKFKVFERNIFLTISQVLKGGQVDISNIACYSNHFFWNSILSFLWDLKASTIYFNPLNANLQNGQTHSNSSSVVPFSVAVAAFPITCHTCNLTRLRLWLVYFDIIMHNNSITSF